jgi:nicotinamidase-related amidase
MAKRALVLIDMQKEWVDSDSEYFVGQMTGLIEKTNKLIDYCREKRYKIIFTAHVENDEGEAFQDGTPNIEIIEELKKKSTDRIIIKNKINPFYKTKLENELSLVTEVVVGGLLTNLCVRSFVEAAYDREHDITVVKDCCRAFDDDAHEFTFEDLKNTRPEINFIDLKNLLESKK